MLEYERVIDFCEEHNLSFEELMLLYTLYIRNQNKFPHLHVKMQRYYERRKDIDWVKVVRSLEERDFLKVLKEQKDPKVLSIKDLMITEKFVNLLFIDPEEIWKKFLQRYPSAMVNPEGYITNDYPANIPKEGDKEYFINSVIKHVDRFEAGKIIYYLEEMFDWNSDQQMPDLPARYGVSRFIKNWDVMLKTHLDNKKTGGGGWNTKMY